MNPALTCHRAATLPKTPARPIAYQRGTKQGLRKSEKQGGYGLRLEAPVVVAVGQLLTKETEP